MREASKTLPLLTERELAYLQGKGIDIGCGDDPVRPDAQRFDVEQGDANCITRFVKEVGSFDYVFASHCLEHMGDPGGALDGWWALVKPGGAMFVVVPDEDLYEQGYWPSLFNDDHKFTFSISKQESWSPVSRNLLDLAGALPGAEIVSLRLQDHCYKRAYLATGLWPRAVAQVASGVRRIITRRLPMLGRPVDLVCLLLRFPIDQTVGGASAQNILVVAKTRSGAG